MFRSVWLLFVAAIFFVSLAGCDPDLAGGSEVSGGDDPSNDASPGGNDDPSNDAPPGDDTDPSGDEDLGGGHPPRDSSGDLKTLEGGFTIYSRSLSLDMYFQNPAITGHQPQDLLYKLIVIVGSDAGADKATNDMRAIAQGSKTFNTHKEMSDFLLSNKNRIHVVWLDGLGVQRAETSKDNEGDWWHLSVPDLYLGIEPVQRYRVFLGAGLEGYKEISHAETSFGQDAYVAYGELDLRSPAYVRIRSASAAKISLYKEDGSLLEDDVSYKSPYYHVGATGTPMTAMLDITEDASGNSIAWRGAACDISEDNPASCSFSISEGEVVAQVVNPEGSCAADEHIILDNPQRRENVKLHKDFIPLCDEFVVRESESYRFLLGAGYVGHVTTPYSSDWWMTTGFFTAPPRALGISDDLASFPVPINYGGTQYPVTFGPVSDEDIAEHQLEFRPEDEGINGLEDIQGMSIQQIYAHPPGASLSSKLCLGWSVSGYFCSLYMDVALTRCDGYNTYKLPEIPACNVSYVVGESLILVSGFMQHRVTLLESQQLQVPVPRLHNENGSAMALSSISLHVYRVDNKDIDVFTEALRDSACWYVAESEIFSTCKHRIMADLGTQGIIEFLQDKSVQHVVFTAPKLDVNGNLVLDVDEGDVNLSPTQASTLFVIAKADTTVTRNGMSYFPHVVYRLEPVGIGL